MPWADGPMAMTVFVAVDVCAWSDAAQDIAIPADAIRWSVRRIGSLRITVFYCLARFEWGKEEKGGEGCFAFPRLTRSRDRNIALAQPGKEEFPVWERVEKSPGSQALEGYGLQPVRKAHGFELSASAPEGLKVSFRPYRFLF